MRLNEKIVLVTGSTTGIGEAIARRVVDEGGRVMIHGRDADRGRALLDQLGDRARFIRADLADPAAAPTIVDAVIQQFGRLDGLVNNAACVARGDLASTDAAFFDRMVAVNIRAPLLLIRAACHYLKQSRGSVLNIGSTNGYSGESQLLAYSISKGGLMTLSRNLADALCQDGIRVNHFNVGWVLTKNEYQQKITDGFTSDWPERIEPIFAPSRSLLTPEMIAGAAIYWLSDESRPISGSVLELEQYPVIGRKPEKRCK
jgi:NAD(P)-dependent dehydrogenase (short-subunit alcohol dehydrogenase family)